MDASKRDKVMLGNAAPTPRTKKESLDLILADIDRNLSECRNVAGQINVTISGDYGINAPTSDTADSNLLFTARELHSKSTDLLAHLTSIRSLLKDN